MTASTTGMPSSTGAYSTPKFWGGLWRTSGIQFVGLFVVAHFLYGSQPGVGASADALAAFYDGDRTRILIATFLSGLNLLNLLWFTAALRTTLVEAGQEGWGAAATAASATFGALFLLQTAVGGALAYSLAGSGDPSFAAGLNAFGWALVVASAFPRAMLIMSGVFGLWRGGQISSGAFTVGVGAVVLAVLGGATWMKDGLLAVDGAYTRVVMPIVLLLWVVGVSRVLLTRSPAARTGW